MIQKSRILITCPKGLAQYLSREVSGLGLSVIEEMTSGIATQGTMEDAMMLNLRVRTGHRVLYHIADFKAGDAEALYSGISRLDWEDYIDERGYFSVSSHVENPTITDTRYANLKCKDAIADRIRKKKGRRPDSGPGTDRACVFLFWKGEDASIYLDTSGEPLSKRGYRKIPMHAPMQETLASAVLTEAGVSASWQGNIVNPMCGSGTLAIEAALIALDRAPGLLRGNFAFMHLMGFDDKTWREMREAAKAASKNKLHGRIIATDIDPSSVEATRKNAETAGVGRFIETAPCDYSDTDVPDGGGIVIVNPEYGVRMGQEKELEKVYKGLGDFFKQKCAGYRGYVFTGNPNLAKKIGLRAKRRLIFYNAKVECRLLEYELYEGRREASSAIINQDD